jgi:hypothetical protein
VEDTGDSGGRSRLGGVAVAAASFSGIPPGGLKVKVEELKSPL